MTPAAVSESSVSLATASRLESLANNINEARTAAQSTLRNSVQHALQAGRLLVEAKSLVPSTLLLVRNSSHLCRQLLSCILTYRGRRRTTLTINHGMKNPMPPRREALLAPLWAEQEQLFPLTSPEQLGIARSVWTLRRWADPQIGLHSHATGEWCVLESWLVGCERCTSREALRRFFRRLNGLEVES